MKKLKKLFNLLPAFALAVISGLGVVLDHDQTSKEVKAENDYLVSQRSVTNYDYTYTNNGVIFHYYFDFNFYLYNVLSNNTYYYVVNGRSYLGRNSVTYNDYTYGNGYQSSDYYVDFNLVSSSFIFEGNTSNINIYFNGTLVNTSLSGFNDLTSVGGHYAWIWYVTQRIRINYDDRDLYLYYPKNLQSSTNASDYSLVSATSNTNNFPSVFTTGVVSSTASRAIVSYSVDLSRSNYDLGYEDGYSAGYNDGFNNGYAGGTSTGYDNGYQVGYQEGVDSQQQAITDAYNNGYSAGYDEGFSVDSTTATIFSGILQVGLLPVNVLLAIFNFEILGINLSAFISAILTVCLTVIVIRTVTGGKNSE